jgi:polyketide synthase PksJ
LAFHFPGKKLDKKNIEDIFALTPTQEGMLFHYLQDPGSDFYFEQLSLEISAEIKPESFEKAWDFVVETNEMLRATFRWENVENPIQIILKTHRCSIIFYDLSAENSSRKKTALEEIKAKDRRNGFDLNQVPFRVTLCQLGESKYEMVISNHHILYDGWSTGILLHEFFEAYHNLAKGSELVKPVKRKFKEFVQWVQRQDTRQQAEFWRGYLKGFATKREFPVNAVKTGAKNQWTAYALEPSAAVQAGLEAYTTRYKLTLGALFYSAWGVLLQRYTDSRDVIFGTTVSGRRAGLAGIETMVGLLINTIPLRVQVDATETTANLLTGIYKSVQTREPFQATSLVDLKEYSEIDNKESLFNSIVVIENYPLQRRLKSEAGSSGLTVSHYTVTEITGYDLTLSILSVDKIAGVEMTLTYNSALFAEQTITGISRHFSHILEEIITHPGKRVIEIEMLSAEEKQKILYDFNDTAAPYPADLTVIRLFERQVTLAPDAIALLGTAYGVVPGQCHPGANNRRLQPPPHIESLKDVFITTTELNEKSLRLARVLRNKGIKQGSVVGLMPKRSLEIVIAILAILKSGGAYLPIAPDYPGERIALMMKDSHARVLLTHTPLPAAMARVEMVDLNLRYSPVREPGPAEHRCTPLDPVYVVYTSGTTGIPKGAIIENRSLVNFLEAMARVVHISPADRLLSLTTISFDIFGLEIFLPLTRGAVMVAGGYGQQMNPGDAARIMKREKITLFQVTPSRLQHLLAEADFCGALQSLRYLLVGGEAFPQGLPENVLQHTNAKLYNLYGPAETTIWSTAKELTAGARITIGKPLANTRVYILNRDHRPQPVDIAGELYIGGDGLARGYLNRPELTAERFDQDFQDFQDHHDKEAHELHELTRIKSTFNKKFLRGGPGGAVFSKSAPPGRRRQKLYKTGDLAKWLPEGEIEFLGRIDQQVKVRGFRIEPGEIENCLRKYPDLKEALVVGVEPDNELCAYFTALQPITASQLRKFLSLHLPPYMVPSFFVHLDVIPLTPNGKVERKRLPQPRGERPELDSLYVEPANEVEGIISRIWTELLGIKNPGMDDHFFDLGGNSLRLIRLNSQLNRQFKKNIPMTRMFRYPTIRSLARHIKGEETEEAEVAGTGAKGKKRLDIAVIGMAGRLPGADHIAGFWENLIAGREAITFVTGDSWETPGVDIRAKGRLDNHHCFDSVFFKYSSREAEQMDPQVRIFHECVWEALEDAGYAPGVYNGLIGLYAGASANPLWEAALLMDSLGGTFSAPWESLQYRDKDFLSTRVAHRLNLKGPAISLHTACSTSLVAIDIACRGLSSGQCHLALAGGVSVTLQDEAGYLYQEGMILSPDGHCRAFDASARGTVGGNGAGVVVLKPLARAIAAGDNIYAVIKGSAVNNDGLDKLGYTAPGVDGQAAVIRAALQSAGIEPETISYLEAHGTGTPLGDPTEVEGLTLAFDTAKQNFCALGSVKTNIGHLDTAAGAAGFIKTVLALKHKKIPPSLHFETPNPKIDFDNSPFYVNTGPGEWQAGDHPRRAGVSSFGIGGTNAHVVLEEWSENNENREQAPGYPGTPQLILLSAATPTALERAARNLADHFKKNPGVNLADAAYTLQVGRQALSCRRMVVCADVEEAIELLSEPYAGGDHNGGPDEEQPEPIFLFPGQGSQYVDMGKELYENEPLFREEMNRCFEILTPLLGYDIKARLYPSPKSDQSDNSGLSDPSDTSDGSGVNRTEIAQPLIFSLEYALAKLLMQGGISPRAMIGHSIGEYAAACLSGFFSLEEALKLVALRGKLMQQVPGGAMLGVSLAEEALIPLLEGNQQLSLAAVNSTSLCTVSGPHEAVAAFEKKLADMGYTSQRLHTSHAFHSPMMDPILAPFKEAAANLIPHMPHTSHTLKIPFISNVTGDWLTAAEAGDPGYWTRHLRSLVRFSDGIEKLVQKKNALFIEVGPGRVLSTLVRKHRHRQPQQQVIETLRHPGDQGSDLRCLLTAVGGLWLRGIDVRWSAFHENQKRRRISLPTYSFERIPYPFKIVFPQARIPAAATAAAEQEVKSRGDSEKKRNRPDWFYIPTWQPQELPDISDAQPCSREPWLVFIDRWGTALLKRLRQQNPALVTVIPGPAFAPDGDISSQYTLNPREPGNYNALLQELEKTVGVPGKILHLWNVHEARHYPGNPEEVAKIQDLGFYSLLHLARALGKEYLDHTFDILVVSSNMREVTGGELHQPYSATLGGAAAIIPQEYPNITIRSIDIDIQEEKALTDEIPGHIFREFIAGPAGQVIALRGGKRWVQGVEPVELEASADSPSRLREEGVYLVTGGLGGIGLVLAGYLAQKKRARLVLTGRSPFLPRQEWEEWLTTHPEEDPLNKRIRKLQSFETLGARVLVLKADAADEEQMRQVKKQTLERFGALHGIIHCAGVPGGGVIQGQPLEHFEKVLAPKVTGTWVLDTLFKNEPLDFFLCCSSINAVVPVFGQSAYTAANTFLDAYARYKTYHNPKGTFYASINWDTWQEVGMAAKTAAGSQSRRVSHPLLHSSRETGTDEILYTSAFSVELLDEHRIMGKAVLPGTAYLEMVRAAIARQVGPAPLEIRDLYFSAPLVVEDDEEREIHTLVKRKDDRGTFEFSIFSRETAPGGKEPFQWQYAAGNAAVILESQGESYEIAGLETLCPEAGEISPGVGPTGAGSAAMTFGPRWSNIKGVSYGKRRGLVRLELSPVFAQDLLCYGLHPALLDTAAVFLQSYLKGNDRYLPAGYKKVRIFGPLPASCIAFAHCPDNPVYPQNSTAAEQALEFNIALMTEKGEPLVEIEGFVMKKVGVLAAPNFRLHIAAPGNLETLGFLPAPLPGPGPGEVEIEVEATGLNFKEVLIALGLVPAPADTGTGFGLECSGRITACGEGVTDFKSGDAVIAYGTSFFSRRNTVPAANVAHMPRHLDFSEAATIPVAFMTAYHSLVQLARLSKDERVLIHSAAGGVGLAAVKIAQWKGAEIFATAGTPQKREYLRSLGVRHVMASHSLSFADEVMTITSGRGVDVLLNSLAGEFISRGLAVLAPYGRFLEIGIRDILNNTALGLGPFEKCLSFFSINLSEKLPGFTALLRQVASHFAAKELTPLPFRVFPIEETVQAFKTMAHAKHTGKIVVTQHRQRTAAKGTTPGSQSNLHEKKGLLPAEGVEIFSRILSAPHLLPTTGKPFSQLIVSTGDLRHRLNKSTSSDDLPAPDPMNITPPPGVVQPRPRLSTPYSPPLDDIQRKLTQTWKDYLGLDKVGIHDNFFELGATSLDIIQISAKLKETANLDIPVVTLFTYSTIHALTGYLKGGDGSPGDTAVNKDVLEAAKKGKNRLKNQKKRRN